MGVSFCPTSAARENTKLHRSSIETKTCSALLEVATWTQSALRVMNHELVCQVR